MITGFERETYKLSESECLMIKPMIIGLSRHVGKDNAITSDLMISGMKKQGHNLSGARLRKLINFIRVTGKVKNVIATSNGYYIATTRQEIEDYKKSLDERISAIQQLRDSFE